MSTAFSHPINVKQADGKSVFHGEPIWRPLVARLGEPGACEWMFMGSYELVDGTLIHTYKHTGSREYLNLSCDSDAWVFCPTSGPAYARATAPNDLLTR